MHTSFWISNLSNDPDQTVHFRGKLEVLSGGILQFHHLGVGCYLIWLDGQLLCDGPTRFHEDFPEYQTTKVDLPSGVHQLDILCNSHGVGTRLLHAMSPFMYIRLTKDDSEIPIAWMGRRLDRHIHGQNPLVEEGNSAGPLGRLSRIRRINPQLGWMEFMDGRLEMNFQSGEDPPGMQDVIAADINRNKLRPASIRDVLLVTHQVTPCGAGLLRNVFGYDFDDPPAGFILRDLVPRDGDAEGIWRRYDLGRVRLSRPSFCIDAPAGTVLEFAACEALVSGRVSPFITLSAGTSCNMCRFIARGGPQEYLPISPLGGRFWEVHLHGLGAQGAQFIREEFVEREYYSAPEGSFESSDAQINAIWAIGVETLRACSEDALTDNPTRERGQWTGDVTAIGMEIASVVYNDLRIMRRAYIQATHSARADGLIAGMHPGEEAYLPNYALHWYEGVLRHHELTGEMDLLHTLRPAAERNLALFRRHVDSEGLHAVATIDFVDWGYVPNEGPVLLASNLFYLSALLNWERWLSLLGDHPSTDQIDHRSLIQSACRRLIQRGLSTLTTFGPDFRFHDAVLALRLGLMPESHHNQALDAIADHIRACFPNDRHAPRLSSPTITLRRLITPYFMHYCLPLFIHAGRMDFVLDQYRQCWSWPMEEGLTTWPEVFDLRWSHAHAWAGCPTWQLSRHLLGMSPRRDLGHNVYTFEWVPSTLDWARGKLPTGDGDLIEIEWRQKGGEFLWRMASPKEIELRFPEVWKGPKALRGERISLTLRCDPEWRIAAT